MDAGATVNLPFLLQRLIESFNHLFFFCFLVSIILNRNNNRLQEKTIDSTPLTARMTKVSIGKSNKIYPKQYIHDTIINN